MSQTRWVPSLRVTRPPCGGSAWWGCLKLSRPWIEKIRAAKAELEAEAKQQLAAESTKKPDDGPRKPPRDGKKRPKKNGEPHDKAQLNFTHKDSRS